MEIWFVDPFYLFLLFNADQTDIHVGDTVNFANFSYGNPGPITYQWFFEGGTPATSTEVSLSIEYYDEGVFYVTLIGSNDLYTDTVVFENYITVLPVTVIKDKVEINQVYIFPNPGNGLFFINLNYEDTDDLNVKVYYILGEKVLNYSFTNIRNQISLDLTNQESGIYFIKIKTGSTLITKKIAIQH